MSGQSNTLRIELTPGEAKRLAVIAQGLYSRAPFGRGINGLVKAVNHLGYVQIDTISIVSRAHHHVLYSRLPGYKPESLKTVQKSSRQIFEYWAHAAAYLPMENYRFTIPIQRRFQSGLDEWPRSERQLMDRVADRIRSEGPLMSRDFDQQSGAAGNWWDWKPAKRALHRLFLQGELMVSYRENFQRVFDLPERVIPSSIATQAPTEIEYLDFLIDSYLKAHAFGSSKMISYLRRGLNAKVSKRLQDRLVEGSLIEVSIKGKDHPTLVGHPDVKDLLGRTVRQQARILSPFDNLVIQRERLKMIFDFDYQIECYVPKEKRIFGYYVLPVLVGSKLIGRLDAKADRKSGIFNVLSVYLEKHVELDDLRHRLESELEEYAKFCGCSEVRWSMA